MLALRLARGAGPLELCRRTLLAAAAGGVGFLLLSALGHAAGHPDEGRQAALRLAWCALPLAATVQLAAAVARAGPASGTRPGLDAAGLGPARLPVLAAVSTAVAAALGSAAALALFLRLGEDGAAGLPLAAAFTLLAVVPLATGTASALATRVRAHRPVRPARPVRGGKGTTGAAGASDRAGTAGLPAALPWGTALAGAGAALGGYADGGVVAGAPQEIPPAVACGWLLIAAGLVLAGPGLTELCGRLLATGQPGALRLLSGRALQVQAPVLGRPLGALCAACAALPTALRLEILRQPGPLGGPGAWLGAWVVLACVLGTVATTAGQARTVREPTADTLRRMGAPHGLLRGAAALRAAALLALFAPLAWLASLLLALPVAS